LGGLTQNNREEMVGGIYAFLYATKKRYAYKQAEENKNSR